MRDADLRRDDNHLDVRDRKALREVVERPADRVAEPRVVEYPRELLRDERREVGEVSHERLRQGEPGRQRVRDH